MKKIRKKQFDVHTFKVGNRSAQLTQMRGYEDKFQLSFGTHYVVGDGHNPRWASHQQKQLRQYLYNRLDEMGLEKEYVCVLGFPAKLIEGKSTFVDLAITAPNAFGPDFKMNENFCRELIGKFSEGLN